MATTARLLQQRIDSIWSIFFRESVDQTYGFQVENSNSLVEELAIVSAKEKAMLEEGRELLVTVAKLQVSNVPWIVKAGFVLCQSDHY